MNTHNHQHHQGCTHCACNNPVLNIMKEHIFSPENIARFKEGLTAIMPAINSQCLLITGGIIRPMIDGSTDTVEAIGINDGKVVAQGTLEAVTQAMSHYKYTTKTLEAGQTLLPGLIEPHVHIVPSALMMSWIDVSPFDGQIINSSYGLSWLTNTLQSNIPSQDGYWVLANGLDPAFFPFQDDDTKLYTITNVKLDGIIEDKEVMILSASGHTMYLNTLALTTVYNNNPDLKTQYPTVQDYINDTQGQLQEEVMMAPALKSIPKLQYADIVANASKHLANLFQQANALGVTFMYDAAMQIDYRAILDIYLAAHLGSVPVRMGAAHVCTSVSDIDNIGKYTQPASYSDVYYGHIKLISDGSNQGLTGYQSEPYQCDPGNYGIFDFLDPKSKDTHPLTPPDAYKQMISTAIKKYGWPLMIHANGDLAIDFALDVYQEYVNPSDGLRHRIEHCSLIDVSTNQLGIMKNIGISPSFLIGHVGYWGYAFDQIIFGHQKSQMLDVCQSAIDSELTITLHSDHLVSPLGPLRMMEQSITRIMEAAPVSNEMNVLNPHECLTAEQALVAVTNNAAWQCYADKWVGSLAQGYYADFTILAQDPLTMTDPYMNMRNITVLETWKGGAQVYANVTEDVSASAAI